jgi:hypothetical protein
MRRQALAAQQHFSLMLDTGRGSWLKSGARAPPVASKKERRMTARFPHVNKALNPAASSSVRQERGILEHRDMLLK